MSIGQVLMVGGSKMVFELDGGKSTTRLAAEKVESFIVNTGGGPSDIFVLYKVEAKKKSRQAVAAKFGTLGMKGAQGVLVVNVKLLKSGIYELIPASKLEKGEYFFASKTANSGATTNADVYAFGID